jgi:hypothetical protein
MPLPTRTALMTLLAAFILGLGIGGFTVSRPAVPPSMAQPPPEDTGGTPSASATSEAQLRLTARATPPSGGSFTISGGLSPARSGVSLIVQRLEDGHWRDFPAQTTTSGQGSYRVSLRSGRTGQQAFRIVSPGADAISNEVRVTLA